MTPDQSRSIPGSFMRAAQEYFNISFFDSDSDIDSVSVSDIDIVSDISQKLLTK